MTSICTAVSHFTPGDRASREITWTVAPTPASVRQARKKCSARLQAWDLDELSFTTGLLVSELLTNAIRYGREPIGLRLIHRQLNMHELHGVLICEVSDGSSTSPHPRNDGIFAGSGRGLLLISQLAQNWGIRRTTQGKTVWAMQILCQPVCSVSRRGGLYCAASKT
jgi:anti-sigma regulatory factor (Ser/Thr protein kinase)